MALGCRRSPQCRVCRLSSYVPVAVSLAERASAAASGKSWDYAGPKSVSYLRFCRNGRDSCATPIRDSQYTVGVSPAAVPLGFLDPSPGHAVRLFLSEALGELGAIGVVYVRSFDLWFTRVERMMNTAESPNKSLQPTATAVMPPAAQEIMPAVAVAEH
jgi:hypothetical protein